MQQKKYRELKWQARRRMQRCPSCKMPVDPRHWREHLTLHHRKWANWTGNGVKAPEREQTEASS